jgi:hypothetical protein
MKRGQRKAAMPASKGWQCQRDTGRYLWWDAGRTASRDWAFFGYLFLFLLVSLALVLGLVLWAMGFLNLFIAGLGLAALTAIAARLAYAIASSPSIFRAEFNMQEAHLSLHETQFPNRERHVIVPFAAVTILQAVQYESWPACLSLHYQSQGKRHERRIGGALDERDLQAMLASLKPMLGDRILPMLEICG